MGAILAFLGRLAPQAVLLIGLAGGGTIIGGLGWAYNVLIDNPQVAREATARANDACTIRTMDAANKARDAERARQQAIMADALRAYQQAVEARQQQLDATQDQMAQQEADYEQQLEGQGRYCTLDDGDLKFLRGTK